MIVLKINGKDFKYFSFDKYQSDLNSKAVNVIPLELFEKVVFELALKGNLAAIEFCRAMIGLSLQQLFADAFGKKHEANERQEYLKDRLDGKFKRRFFTDAIQDYIDRNALSTNEQTWIYKNVSDKLNKLLFGKTAKQLCKKYECAKNELRDQFDRKDVLNISRLEDYAARLVDKKNLHPIKALEQAYEFWIAE
jgi:hypothetical protein